jgi:hypothetical protein
MATVHPRVRFAALALLLAAPACGERPLGDDGGSHPSMGMEAGRDVGPGDAVAAPDAPLDVPAAVDAPADTASDGARPDAATDAPPDASPDGTCGAPTDPRNCGTCGHDCTALLHVRADKVGCQGGACVIPADGCLPGWDHCSSDPERGCDSDVTQRYQCGGCNTICPTAAPLCTAPTAGPPACVASCAGTGLTDCGGDQCVDLQTSNAHCGACGAGCVLPNAQASCVAGSCTLVRCEPGYADCDPSAPGCDTILGRFFDCRSCGDSCAAPHATAVCAATGCTRTCHDGYGNCAPSSHDCETPLDTAANCGACGHACQGALPLCGGARGAETCVATCGAPSPDVCGTSCTNLQSDPRHCGACGTACDGYQACVAGRCTPRYVKTDLLSAPEGATQANGAAIASDGSAYVSGYFTTPTDFDPGPAQEIHTPVTSLDSFITKLNADGSYAWTRTWATGGALGVAAVASDGSVFATGWFVGRVDFDPGAGVTRLGTDGVNEAVVLKLSADGQLVWARAFTMTVEDAADAEGGGLALGPDGSIYTSGVFRGQIDLDPGAGTDLHRTINNDVFNVYVVKLTAAGNFVWGRAITGSADGEAGPVAVDSAGRLWIGGAFGGVTDLDPGAGTDMHTADGFTDGFVARWDVDGNYQTSWVYGGGDYDAVGAISFDADGSTYVSGDSVQDDGVSSVSTGFVQKLDAADALIWERRGPSIYLGTAAPGGGVLYIGGSEDPSVEPMLVTKLDGDGKMVWSIPAPNPAAFFGTAFAADATKLIITGQTDRGAFDLDPGAGTDILGMPGGAITRYAF